MYDIIKKYNNILKQILGDMRDDIQLTEYKKTESWNSLNHISIITTIEDTFNITFEPKDIFKFKTYHDGLDIILEKLENN